MSTTSPNTIWTPDFFWEAPPDAREHIEYFNALSPAERCEAAYLRGEYFASVDQAVANQPPELIKEFAKFVLHRVVIDGTLTAPRNPVAYATIQRASYSGQAENGQTLTTEHRQRLRTPVGKDWLEPERLLTFEEQRARDAYEISRKNSSQELARTTVKTDSLDIYEWPKIPELVKDWPLVEINLQTDGIRLGVAYADYQKGHPLSLPATVERIEAMRTYLEQFPLSSVAAEGGNLSKQS